MYRIRLFNIYTIAVVVIYFLIAPPPFSSDKPCWSNVMDLIGRGGNDLDITRDFRPEPSCCSSGGGLDLPTLEALAELGIRRET